MSDVQVKFNCKKCGLHGCVVMVQERRKDQDVVDWVENVMTPKVDAMHRLSMPRCRGTHCDILLPISSNGIGFIGPPLTEEQHADIQRQLQEES